MALGTERDTLAEWIEKQLLSVSRPCLWVTDGCRDGYSEYVIINEATVQIVHGDELPCEPINDPPQQPEYIHSFAGFIEPNAVDGKILTPNQFFKDPILAFGLIPIDTEGRRYGGSIRPSDFYLQPEPLQDWARHLSGEEVD